MSDKVMQLEAQNKKIKRACMRGGKRGGRNRNKGAPSPTPVLNVFKAMKG